jgi:FtsP/CotA-like multicopper oxidase with cupredoxin domain
MTASNNTENNRGSFRSEENNGIKKSSISTLYVILMTVVLAASTSLVIYSIFVVDHNNQGIAMAISSNNNMTKNTQSSSTQQISNNTINDSKAHPHKEFTMIAEDATIEISPGERVKVWTFNGTVPGPTLRFTEGDNVTIHFKNNSPMVHTLHMHGTHDAKNDGAFPLILPNQTYTYNFIAEPAGAFMYHCHAPPTSLHIRMGMYGSLIIDPKGNNSSILKPAREYAIVLSEYDPNNPEAFIPKYYPMNGYASQYMDNNSLQARQNELVRFYVVNIGTTIPYSFHLHSTIFKVYPSGLISNKPVDVQTVSIGPGDAAIVEAVWKYPGTYLVHSHGLQEERGNMGEIHVIPTTEKNNNTIAAVSNQSSLIPVTNKSVSMIPWQYQLQKELQKPIISNGSGEEIEHSSNSLKGSMMGMHHGMMMGMHPGMMMGMHPGMMTDEQHLATNSSSNLNHENNAASTTQVRILKGSWDTKQKDNYSPKEITAHVGSTITWINDDTLPHTITSDKAGLFDSSIVSAGQKWAHPFVKIGDYEYHCTLRP